VKKMYNEIKKENDEKRESAQLPSGIDSILGFTYVNKFNGAIIKIVKYTVTDSGNVFWITDEGSIVSLSDLSNWVRKPQ